MQIPVTPLPDGNAMPRFGIGTWRMGEQTTAAAAEVALIRAAIESGVALIDTAEMYGEGGAESVIGQAMRDAGVPREQLYLVSKVYPHNASKRGTIAACERSLKRLGTEYLDCYLLHWPGEHPLEDTVAAFELLKAQGKIRAWGVSNFDVADMQALLAAGGDGVATNQVLYNLARRGVEFSLLPWQRERSIPTMAYSPVGQARLLDSHKLKAIARDVGVQQRARAPRIGALPQLDRCDIAVRRPTVDRDHAVARVYGDDDPSRVGSARVFHECW